VGCRKSVELNPRLRGGQKMNMLTKP